MNSFLTFKLNQEIFSIDVVKVLEILELPTVISVPKSPPYMRGVINLRGSVLSVIDSRKKFGLEHKDDTVDTVIIVLQLSLEDKDVQLGMVVDSVQAVLDFNNDDMLPPPSLGKNFNTDFISGVCKDEQDNFIMVIDIDKVFDNDEVIELSDRIEKVKPKTKARSRKVKEKVEA